MTYETSLKVLSFSLSVMLSVGFVRNYRMSPLLVKRMISVGDELPVDVAVDVVEPVSTDAPCKMNEVKDFGSLVKSQNKVVIFGVPGAFTPTCAQQHLPGFIAQIEEFRKKGVDSIYCLSVNDKYVMRSWAESTPGCIASGIKMVADGNADYTKALGLAKDATGSRMGVRCKRFAAIVEKGKLLALNVDEKGMESSSAEKVLSLL